jgi:PAS domain S-box-containing protein
MDDVVTDGPVSPRGGTPGDLTRQFWAIFTRSANPMLLANSRREYVDANAAAESLLGYDRATLLQMRIEDLTPPEFRTGVEETWSTFLAEGAAVGTYEIVRADGSRLTTEFNATAYILPGLHLSIFLQPAEVDDELSVEVPEDMVLTPREREVLERVALGESSPEIAERLVISPETVRQHVQNTLNKLGARTRAQAIGIALRTGQLD